MAKKTFCDTAIEQELRKEALALANSGVGEKFPHCIKVTLAEPGESDVLFMSWHTYAVKNNRVLRHWSYSTQVNDTSLITEIYRWCKNFSLPDQVEFSEEEWAEALDFAESLIKDRLRPLSFYDKNQKRRFFREQHEKKKMMQKLLASPALVILYFRTRIDYSSAVKVACW